MAAIVPTKIVIKSTTRMSLNDRFSSIDSSVQNIRTHMAVEQQVSAANRRLAQQFANRPSLQASTLNIYHQQQPAVGGVQRNVNTLVMKKSLQQRLGKSNIKDRLSLPGSLPVRGRGRGSNIPIHGDGGDNQWMAHTVQNRGGLSQRGLNPRGAFQTRGRGTFNGSTVQNTVNTRGRGVSRGGRGYSRGRGAQVRGGSSNVTLKDLDNQLDEYMARTKSHLDAELDAYMSEVKN